MRLSQHINFDGACEAALNAYADIFGGKVSALNRWRDMPGECPPGMENKLMHGEVTIGSSVLMGADSPPGRHVAPQGFAVAYDAGSAAEAERIFVRLSAGGAISMPMSKTFFAERFGMCTDQYGVPWMIMCETHDVGS